MFDLVERYYLTGMIRYKLDNRMDGVMHRRGSWIRGEDK